MYNIIKGRTPWLLLLSHWRNSQPSRQRREGKRKEPCDNGVIHWYDNSGRTHKCNNNNKNSTTAAEVTAEGIPNNDIKRKIYIYIYKWLQDLFFSHSPLIKKKNNKIKYSSKESPMTVIYGHQ